MCHHIAAGKLFVRERLYVPAEAGRGISPRSGRSSCSGPCSAGFCSAAPADSAGSADSEPACSDPVCSVGSFPLVFTPIRTLQIRIFSNPLDSIPHEREKIKGYICKQQKNILY